MADGNNVPNRKVVVGAFAGALTTVILEVVEKTTGVEFSALFGGALTVVVTFAVQYLVPNAEV